MTNKYLDMEFPVEDDEHNRFQRDVRGMKNWFANRFNDEFIDKMNLKALVLVMLEQPMVEFMKEKDKYKLQYINRIGHEGNLSPEELAYKVSLFDKMYEECVVDVKEFVFVIRKYIKFDGLQDFQVKGGKGNNETPVKNKAKISGTAPLSLNLKSAAIEGSIVTVKMEIMQ